MAGFNIKEFEGRVPCPLCRGTDCCNMVDRRMVCIQTGQRVPHAELVASAKQHGLRPRTKKEQAAWAHMPLEQWESDTAEESRWRVILLNGSHRRTLYRCHYKAPVVAFFRQFIHEFNGKPGNSTSRMAWQETGHDLYRLCYEDGKMFFGNLTIEKVIIE